MKRHLISAMAALCILGAADAAGLGPGLIQCRQQHGRKDGNNGNNNNRQRAR